VKDEFTRMHQTEKKILLHEFCLYREGRKTNDSVHLAFLKQIFLSQTGEEAMKRFREFSDRWSGMYPRPLYNMEKRLGSLLKYYEYPESIRRSIHSTNLIERMNKEIRRRIKIIDSLPSEEKCNEDNLS